MSRQEIYRQLEHAMLGYSSYCDVSVNPVDEPMLPVAGISGLCAKQIGNDMVGKNIYVRETVLNKLKSAAKQLELFDSSLELQVVYGYRSLAIQKRLFGQAMARLSSQYSVNELRAAAHRQIASPDIAGHPTGGAVDIQLVDLRGRALDFGTKIWSFVPDSYTYSPYISQRAKSNRRLLREVMMLSGFAPFDGEWWHFSYGDREWAKYYGKPAAIYQQIEFNK